MKRNLVVFIAVIGLLCSFMAASVYAADEKPVDEKAKDEKIPEKKEEPKAEKKPVVEPTKAPAYDHKPRGGEMVNFFGGALFRFHGLMNEMGYAGATWTPFNLNMSMRGWLGASLDYGSVFTRFAVRASNAGLNPPSSWPAFNYMLDFNAGIFEAYGVWRAAEQFNFVFGRYNFVVNGKKKFQILRTPMSFSPEYSMDGLGFFIQAMDSKTMTMNIPIVLAYLGRAPGVPPVEYGYLYNFLIGIQPQLYMKGDMSITASLGFWGITQSVVLTGSDLIDYASIQVYFKLAIPKSKIAFFIDILYNVGDGSDTATTATAPFGAYVGFTYGSLKKKGGFLFNINFYYIQRYCTFGLFTYPTVGNNKKGIIINVKYKLDKALVAFLQITARNNINAPGVDTTTGDLRIKLGIVVSFDTCKLCENPPVLID